MSEVLANNKNTIYLASFNNLALVLQSKNNNGLRISKDLISKLTFSNSTYGSYKVTNPNPINIGSTKNQYQSNAPIKKSLPNSPIDTLSPHEEEKISIDQPAVVIHVILGLIFHDIRVTKQYKSRNYGI